jgi:hypothetical protein
MVARKLQFGFKKRHFAPILEKYLYGLRWRGDTTPVAPYRSHNEIEPFLLYKHKSYRL